MVWMWVQAPDPPNEETMAPPDFVTRTEFEDRLGQLRRDTQALNDHQDNEWNTGFRAIRADVEKGIASVQGDVARRSDALEKLFAAQLDPVVKVMYAMVGTLFLILTGLVASLIQRAP